METVTFWDFSYFAFPSHLVSCSGRLGDRSGGSGYCRVSVWCSSSDRGEYLSAKLSRMFALSLFADCGCRAWICGRNWLWLLSDISDFERILENYSVGFMQLQN